MASARGRAVRVICWSRAARWAGSVVVVSRAARASTSVSTSRGLPPAGPPPAAGSAAAPAGACPGSVRVLGVLVVVGVVAVAGNGLVLRREQRWRRCRTTRRGPGSGGGEVFDATSASSTNGALVTPLSPDRSARGALGTRSSTVRAGRCASSQRRRKSVGWPSPCLLSDTAGRPPLALPVPRRRGAKRRPVRHLRVTRSRPGRARHPRQRRTCGPTRRRGEERTLALDLGERVGSSVTSSRARKPTRPIVAVSRSPGPPVEVGAPGVPARVRRHGPAAPQRPLP